MAPSRLPSPRVRFALLGLSLGLAGTSPALAGCPEGPGGRAPISGDETDAAAAEVVVDGTGVGPDVLDVVPATRRSSDAADLAALPVASAGIDVSGAIPGSGAASAPQIPASPPAELRHHPLAQLALGLFEHGSEEAALAPGGNQEQIAAALSIETEQIVRPEQVAAWVPQSVVDPLELHEEKVARLPERAARVYAALRASPSALGVGRLSRATRLRKPAVTAQLRALVDQGLARVGPYGWFATRSPTRAAALERAETLAQRGRLPWGSIARLVDVPRSSLHRHLTNRGLTPPTTPLRPDELAARRRELRRLARERARSGAEWTIAEVAQEAGVPQTTAWADLARHQIRTPHRPRPRRRTGALRSRAIKLAIKDRRTGHPYLRDTEIAARIGEPTAQMVSRWLRAAEGEGLVTPRPIPAEEELAAAARGLWDAEKLTLGAIRERLAERYGTMTHERVSAWLHAHEPFTAAAAQEQRERAQRVSLALSLRAEGQPTRVITQRTGLLPDAQRRAFARYAGPPADAPAEECPSPPGDAS